MNWPALILAIAAIALFLACHFGVQRTWVTTNLGLAFFAAALVVQAVFVGLHQVTVH